MVINWYSRKSLTCPLAPRYDSPIIYRVVRTYYAQIEILKASPNKDLYTLPKTLSYEIYNKYKSRKRKNQRAGDKLTVLLQDFFPLAGKHLAYNVTHTRLDVCLIRNRMLLSESKFNACPFH